MKIKLIILPILFFLFSFQVFGRDRIVDNAGILSASEKDGLINLMDSIATAYNFDLVIVTETDIGDTSPGDYANSFFNDNGYGIGNDRDGCLFLRVTGSRDYWFSTFGRCEKILNSTAFGKLESDTGKYLGENNYYAAFSTFVQDWDQFLSLEAQGRSYNFFYQWNLVLMLIAWLIAIGIGCGIVYIWKRGMNTAMLQTQAAAYVVSGSLNFTAKKDSLLFSKVNKIKKSSGGSSAGGAALMGSLGKGLSGGRGGRR
jgi:uncharacterized protein